MKVSSFTKNTLALAVSAASVMSFNAVAAEGKNAVLEEIMVTATRRSMSVQDIPINITAMSGEAIESAGILNAQELMRAIPGVSIPDSGARLASNNNNISIRGLNVNPSATDRAFLSDPTVSTYVGDTAMFANFMLKDVERVEVLRGPQGTLYGSGSLGGTVRYIMKKPSTEGFEAKVGASYGQTDGSDGNNYSVDAMINVPVSDSVALRVSAGRTDNDGVIDYANVYAADANGDPLAAGGDLGYGAPVYENMKDADTVEVDHVRASILFAPNEDFEAELSYMKQDGKFGGRRQTTSGLNGLGESYGKYEIGAVVLEPAKSESEATSLELEYDLGFATLSSSSSHYERSYDGVSDNTGFAAAKGWLVYYGYGLFPRINMAAERHNEEKAFVQELRLASNGENTIDWIAGVYYKDQESSANQDTYVRGMKAWHNAVDGDGNGLDDTTGDYVGAWYNLDDLRSFAWEYDSTFEDLAFFGELTWHLSDTVDATFGARNFHNENTVRSSTAFPVWYLGNPEIIATEKDSGTLLKGNLSIQLNDEHMAYVTVSEGYRRGGTNAAPVRPDVSYPNDPEWGTFKSDSVVNYELGLKGGTDSFTYSASLFRVDWKDPQLNVATPSGAYYAVANGDEARSQGIETEFNWQATEAINISGGYTLLDAQLTKPLMLHDASDATQGKSELRATNGAKLPGSARHAINLGVSHSFALSDGLQLVSRIDGFYQSETENSILNTDPAWKQTLPGFSLWNASFSLVSEDWTMSLSGKNIFNEKGMTGIYKEEYMTTDPSVGFNGTGQKDFISTPRTISMSASYNF